VEEIGNLKQS